MKRLIKLFCILVLVITVMALRHYVIRNINEEEYTGSIFVLIGDKEIIT